MPRRALAKSNGKKTPKVPELAPMTCPARRDCEALMRLGDPVAGLAELAGDVRALAAKVETLSEYVYKLGEHVAALGQSVKAQDERDERWLAALVKLGAKP